MALVNVKVIIGPATKTFRFSTEQTVSDALKDIQEKIAEDQGGADHGLFQDAVNGKKAKWFKNNRPLKFYNVTNGV